MPVERRKRAYNSIPCWEFLAGRRMDIVVLKRRIPNLESKMRIWFERSGGFAGRKVQGSLDSSRLPESQAQNLAELLKRSHFFDLPQKMRSASPGADRFVYKVTVETDDGDHTIEAAESAVPPDLRPLLDFLTRSLSVK
ncbi:MAG TPA: protealysin inhibitor emfourin [Acidobacteriota bacterium]|nr:protealysin inhibitor emfourin [Acidobacteriota bacterium]